MINNQVQSPLAGKNNIISGQAPGEAKRDAGNQQGGLFKLLMSSVNGETLNGKGDKSGAANILGGNLTLNTKLEGDGKQSALQMLAGSGDESKEEKMTLSKLLEGPASETGASKEGADAGVGAEASDEAVAKESESEEGGEPADDTVKTDAAETGGEPPEGKELSDDGEPISVTDNDTHQTENTTPGLQENSTDGAVTAKAAETGTAGNTSGSANLAAPTATTGEQTASTDQAATHTQRQAVALSGDAAVNQTVSQKAAGSNTKAATPLSGLVSGQDSATNGSQAGGKELVNVGKIVNSDGLAEYRERSEIGVLSEAGRDRLKSEGLVKELRALAAAQGEQLAAGKQERPEPTQLDASALPEDAAPVQEIFTALQSGSMEQVAAEIRSMRANQIRETKYSKYIASFAGRQDISSSGSSLSSGDDSSATTSKAGKAGTMMPVSKLVPGSASVSTEIFDKNGAALWKEQITEYFESKDKSSAENQAAAAFARLGDVAVTNISVRKSFAQGISKAIINSVAQGNKGSEGWQKHNFLLEDGKNIQVSARETDGVLQLKLSSSATELNKLLMDHEKEIRELLENELELKINLQMEGGGDGNAADFFGGSTGQRSNDKGGNNPLGLENLRRTEEKEVEKVVPRAVRKFGYNQNEWTV